MTLPARLRTPGPHIHLRKKRRYKKQASASIDEICLSIQETIKLCHDRLESGDLHPELDRWLDENIICLMLVLLKPDGSAPSSLQ